MQSRSTLVGLYLLHLTPQFPISENYRDVDEFSAVMESRLEFDHMPADIDASQR